MDNRKHLSAADDSVNLEVGGIEVDSFFDGFLVIVGVEESLIMGLIEAVDFVFHVFAKGIDFLLGQPFCVKIASSSVFDQVFVLIRIFTISSP